MPPRMTALSAVRAPKKKRRKTVGPAGSRVGGNKPYQTVDEEGSRRVYRENPEYNRKKGRKKPVRRSTGPVGAHVTRRRSQTVDERGSTKVYSPEDTSYNKAHERYLRRHKASKKKGKGYPVHATLYEDGSVEVTGPRGRRAVGNVGEGGSSRQGYGTSRQYGPTSSTHRLGTAVSKKTGLAKARK